MANTNKNRSSTFSLFSKAKRDAPEAQPYSGLEVVPLSDEKIVVDHEADGDYSTLEVAVASDEKICVADEPQDYSTLEVVDPALQGVNYPFATRHHMAQTHNQDHDPYNAPLPPLPSEQLQSHNPDEISPTTSDSHRRSKKHLLRARLLRECGIWFDKRFYAGEEGMEIKMSRSATLFRDMQWEVMCGESSVMKIRGNPNSWSEKREFMDATGGPLFKTRKQGSGSRVAESVHGQVVFVLKEDTESVSSSWTVDFTNARDKRTIRWNVRGSATTRDIYINCYGIPIGRITRPEDGIDELFKEKNIYIVKVSPGIDFTIMAALTVAYDDLRLEGGAAL
ncbi:uncharacterized protein BP5553_07997 [Venustampulla echinocandica]|uniref:Tubby C-terminal-like domain-containing protein n=1 Tax=Venustampulla echinocandica TaxID=2656787 RepID=A0A370TFF2_9HELO|nr:uncharacterized protein BP5553_07997 [Venustampulla echinocandica]RDL33629.1 hypothetical protein BP5553_07997 [Venustampulla echinocandica]